MLGLCCLLFKVLIQRQMNSMWGTVELMPQEWKPFNSFTIEYTYHNLNSQILQTIGDKIQVNDYPKLHKHCFSRKWVNYAGTDMLVKDFFKHHRDLRLSRRKPKEPGVSLSVHPHTSSMLTWSEPTAVSYTSVPHTHTKTNK